MSYIGMTEILADVGQQFVMKDFTKLELGL